VFRNFSEQFYTDAIGHRIYSLFLRKGIIMSMQHHKPDQAVLADSWTLLCPQCSQKMRIIMAAPTHGGRRAPTSASTGAEKGLRWPFIDGQTVRPPSGGPPLFAIVSGYHVRARKAFKRVSVTRSKSSYSS
jgi:hypothetical protein